MVGYTSALLKGTFYSASYSQVHRNYHDDIVRYRDVHDVGKQAIWRCQTELFDSKAPNTVNLYWHKECAEVQPAL